MKNISFVAAMFLAVMSGGIARAECTNLPLLDANTCASIEYSNADDELNRVYETLPKSNELITSELRWISYRDFHCNAVAEPFRYRPEFYLIRTVCLTAITNQRTNFLLNSFIE